MTDSRSRRVTRVPYPSLMGHESRVIWLTERLRADIPCDECVGIGYTIGDTYNDNCKHCAATGVVWRSRVQLAAYCGDEAAQRVLLDSEFHFPKVSTYAPHERHEALMLWVEGLSRWGAAVHVKASVAAAIINYDTLRRAGWACGSVSGICNNQCAFCATTRAIKSAEAWLRCQCEEHRRLAGRANIGLGTTDLGWGASLGASQHDESLNGLRVEAFSATNCGLQLTSVRDVIQTALIAWALP